MATLRQNGSTDGLFDPAYLARGLGVSFADRHELASHSHPWPQLVYAAEGVMHVRTESSAWLVPTTRAIWMPAGVRHSIRMRGPVAMRTLYLAPSALHWPRDCRALEVTPLLRELVLHLVRLGAVDPDRPDHRRQLAVLADLVSASETVPLTLPMPRDGRALMMVRRLLDEPGQSATVAELARSTGASVRTLQRLFRAETGLSLESWRLRARMQQGVVALSGGASVTEAALACGYSTPGAFIGAFKRTFGVTPARYGRARG